MKEREREGEREERERGGRGGKRDRVANSRYYVGSFRCESIWQIGQSLRGQNFSSGCDDGVGMRGCWSEGVVSGCTRMMEGESVRKLFRRVHFLPDWWVPFCRWMGAQWTLVKRNRESGPNLPTYEFDWKTDFVDFETGQRTWWIRIRIE